MKAETPPESPEFIRRLLSRESDAWGEFISRYDQRLRAFLKSLRVKPEAVDDVLQDTYTDLLNGIDGYKLDGNFAAYLFKIAANNATDYFRKRGRQEPTIQSRDSDEYNPMESVAAPMTLASTLGLRGGTSEERERMEAVLKKR